MTVMEMLDSTRCSSFNHCVASASISLHCRRGQLVAKTQEMTMARTGPLAGNPSPLLNILKVNFPIGKSALCRKKIAAHNDVGLGFPT